MNHSFALISVVLIVSVFVFMSGCTQSTQQQASSGADNGINDAPASEGRSNVNDTTLPENQNTLSVNDEEKEDAKPLVFPFEGSHFGFMHPEKSITYAAELNVHWARPHPGPFIWSMIERQQGSYDFSDADREIRLLQDNNFTAIATIWPYNDIDQQTCRQQLSDGKMRGFMMLGRYRQKPCNMDAYKNFVKAIVERYDGDGVNDMPGLKYPIKYWEVINEPSLEDITFFEGSAQDYYDILKATYEAVHEADPDAKIVNGGMAGFMPEAEDFWSEVIRLGGAKYFDIFTHHSIGMDKGLLVSQAKGFMKKNGIENKEHWITEAEFEAHMFGKDMMTPDEWSEAVTKSFVEAFAKGIDKIFYVGLDESPGDPESWLIGPGSKKQQIFYAFETMISKIDYFTAAEKVNEGQYKFIVDEKPVYVLWSGSIPEEITGTVIVTDLSGNKKTMNASDLALSGNVAFVQFP
ncbi:MAG: hypothetical protein GXO64_04680 [Candidatus Micrarchaeota archaeon]|nr:hypothetical protein [Candidatus Micrarchaeota archaeon]